MMYFCYLPDYYRYSSGNEYRMRHFLKDTLYVTMEKIDKNVLRVVSELNIPLIDIHREVFAPHSDPLSLFHFRRRGHYNVDGYKLVAESIAKRLKTDGFVPKEVRDINQ